MAHGAFLSAFGIACIFGATYSAPFTSALPHVLPTYFQTEGVRNSPGFSQIYFVALSSAYVAACTPPHCWYCSCMFCTHSQADLTIHFHTIDAVFPSHSLYAVVPRFMVHHATFKSDGITFSAVFQAFTIGFPFGSILYRSSVGIGLWNCV
jgi:hypothetical protein